VREKSDDYARGILEGDQSFGSRSGEVVHSQPRARSVGRGLHHVGLDLIAFAFPRFIAATEF